MIFKLATSPLKEMISTYNSSVPPECRLLFKVEVGQHDVFNNIHSKEDEKKKGR